MLRDYTTIPLRLLVATFPKVKRAALYPNHDDPLFELAQKVGSNLYMFSEVLYVKRKFVFDQNSIAYLNKLDFLLLIYFLLSALFVLIIHAD